ncbi:MAG: DMT family transporter [Planctomycetia bacterium]|nr:DMT family transporter [Planctomycetia bacterium]
MKSGVPRRKNVVESEEPASGFSWWYLLFPLLSSIFYTLANTCMRQVAGGGASIPVAIAMRESVAFYVALPIFLWQFRRGKAVLPPWRLIFLFFLTSLGVQIFGNIFLQQAFRDVGMAASVAGSWTGSLLGAPLLAWLWLHERISKRVFFSIGLVFLALFFLTSGARLQECSIHSATLPVSGWFSNPIAVRTILLTVLSGVIFSASNCVIRKMGKEQSSLWLPMVILPGTGFLVLTFLDGWEHGLESYRTFTRHDILFAYLAGFANILAFFSLIMGLRRLKVVQVSIVNVSQLAFAPLIGYFLFHEPMNVPILAGIFLVMTAIIISNTSTKLRS